MFMNFNSDTFRALSSPTRLKIIKSLKARRKTQTELSDELKMHVSTVKEHLDKLENAGLVSINDEGYKWKYYSLTTSAEKLMFSTEISIVLPVSVLFIMAGMARLNAIRIFSNASDSVQKSGQALPAMSESVLVETPKEVLTIPTPDYIAYAIVAVGVVLLAYAIYRLIKRR